MNRILRARFFALALAVVTMQGVDYLTPVVSAQEATSEHWYIVPKIFGRLGPRDVFFTKYLVPMGVDFSGLDYGPEPVVIACAQVTPTQHVLISANIDVIAVPPLDDPMTLAGLLPMVTRGEAVRVPLDDFTAESTYRQVVTRFIKVFFLQQQLDGYTSRTGGTVAESFFKDNLSLDDKMNKAVKLPDLLAAAQGLGLDTTGVGPNKPVREGIRLLATQMPSLVICGQTF